MSTVYVMALSEWVPAAGGIQVRVDYTSQNVGGGDPIAVLVDGESLANIRTKITDAVIADLAAKGISTVARTDILMPQFLRGI